MNLFTPSTVAWERPGGAVTLAQATDFPASDRVRLTLAMAAPAEFTLAVRAPAWLAGPIEATVDGAPAEVAVDAQHWASLRRTWRDGDVIALRLPMALRAEPLDPDHPTPAALLQGPVVLAFEAPNARALRDVDPTVPDRVLAPIEGAPLRFRLASDPTITARPFASFGAGERTFVYLDPTMGRRIPHRDLTFAGTWHDAGAFRFSNEVGATAEGTFEGTGVRWLGRRFDDAGTAEVTIDGRVVGVLDQYGPGRDLPFEWSARGLAPGRHTIRIRLLPDKPAASKDRFLNVAGLEVLDDEPAR